MRQSKTPVHLPYAPWLLIPALLALSFLLIPLCAIFLRTPWLDLPRLISSPEATDALWLSVRTCLISTAITTVLGAPLAFVLARTAQWWGTIMRIIVLLPMVLPPVVAGLALLLTWGRRGLLGQYLELGGWSISFSTIAVIFAQVFVSLPFLVMSFESAVRATGLAYDKTAQSLGASRTVTFFRVTLPILSPGLVSAIALAFSRSLGEFGATITFAGSLQGVTRTMPLQIYLQRELDTDQALALAVVLIALASAMLAVTALSHYYWTLYGRIRSWFVRPHLDFDDEDLLAVPSSGPDITVHAHVQDRDVHIDAHFPGKTITAIMGANGSGKSTLLELIAGSLPPSMGTIEFTTHKPRIVLLRQNPLLFPHLTVLGNVEFGLRSAGMSRKDARQYAKKELALVGMLDYAHRNATELSGGQAQRVAIARAMATSPDVVLLDEPFESLDEATTESLRSSLRIRLCASEVTAVFVTHNLLDAQDLADYLVILRRGHVDRTQKIER
ncbi:molybdate ABC transporter permease subunit [Arcanobacterium buesumense]|uniref:Molybdate ABC transporter permease subunit n=1 Tax=Arcanobacterium buesumense TaxID=2722751 RepID=A0A6H2ENR6_9ACTO|nr:molybdate ABC transporter permease subunit [Arcanobacterium buesumense]